MQPKWMTPFWPDQNISPILRDPEQILLTPFWLAVTEIVVWSGRYRLGLEKIYLFVWNTKYEWLDKSVHAGHNFT
jgi:hypothetical protein